MATSALRIRFEAWGNRRFLNNAIKRQHSAKLAAGVLMFMAFRQMLSRRLGRDYLLALDTMSVDERSILLRSIKGLFLQMFVMESKLRGAQGNAQYELACGGANSDPFAHRLAASMAIQLVSAQMVPGLRGAVAKCLDSILAAAAPELPAAYLAARSTIDLQCEMGVDRSASVDNILGHVTHLTLEDLDHPLAPAPTGFSEQHTDGKA